MNLYHYTDVSAVKNILENGRLWLSDIRYLNDHTEYKAGEEILRAIFTQRGASIDPLESAKVLKHLESYFMSSKSSYTFVGSFSQGEDLLSQWRGYCPKEGGYALQFETETLAKFNAPLHECVYDDARKSASAESLFDWAKREIVSRKGNKARKSKLFQTVWSNIARFKNAGFSEEREVRAIIFKRQTDPAIQFRARGNLLIPYFEVEIPYDKLRAVWVGPCQNPDLASESLQRFIDRLATSSKHALSSSPKPKVRISSITYRG